MRENDLGQMPSYFDHAATSWPKPHVVIDAVQRAMRAGGSPGRGGYHMALEASRTLFRTREGCASYLGVGDSRNLIFTCGCTAACNMMLFGTLRSGDRVVVGSMEHNAVSRPLSALAEEGVTVVKVQADPTGLVDPEDVAQACAEADTTAVVCQHASNVTGTIQPIAEIARVAHDAGAVMLVDGAQAAGHIDVDVTALGVDAYAVSGHKGLLGPQGIGLLYIAPGLDVRPRDMGGTGGTRSDPSRMPDERPDRYEPGTPNVPGIAGLGAAVGFLTAEREGIRDEERVLTHLLIEGLSSIEGVHIYGPQVEVERIPVVSITHDGVACATIASRLDREYGIACRAGLHCAPWAHESIGTLETGAVRFGIGWNSAEEEVERLIAAVEAIVA